MRIAMTAALGIALLAGCEETVTESGGDGLSGTPDQFTAMEPGCISQARVQVGGPPGAIVVTDRLRTGGGPLLTLDANGTALSCRLEDDGSVTVFSEFAN